MSQSMRLTASNMRKFQFIGRKLNGYRAASATHTMNNNILNLTVSPVAIAITGGGFSGSLVAANLLRNATIPLSIKLIERNSEVGRGVAYGTPVDCHLLNVPAGKRTDSIHHWRGKILESPVCRMQPQPVHRTHEKPQLTTTKKDGGSCTRKSALWQSFSCIRLSNLSEL
ncbi:MAG: FAD/NAD(P)-binding protein [Nostoc sp.]